MSESELIVETCEEQVAVVTLNRPGRRNALTIELMQSLCNALEKLAAGCRYRVVILRGAGPVFCAGLDLHEAADVDVADASAQCVAKTLDMLANSELVTIAAVHGAAYAGGAGLMAACDFTVAADDLRVCFPEVRRGLVPALVATLLGDRLHGGHLRELLLLAEPINAQRALDLGLVHRIVPGDGLFEESKRLAGTIQKGAPEAIRQTKRLLLEIRAAGSTDRFQQALEFHTRARHSNEAQEGLAAFRERREPRWS